MWTPAARQAAAAARHRRVGSLSTKQRNRLKSSQFGLPGSRRYPMPDRDHAIRAKGRATQMYNKGKLSASDKAKVFAKANAILRQGRH